MDPKKLKRLKELLGKAEGDRTEEEKTELKSLQIEATSHDLDPETGDAKSADEGSEEDENEPEAATVEDLKTLLATEFKTLKEDQGDAPASDEIVAKLVKALDGKFPALKKEDIEAAVRETGALTKADLDEAVKGLRKELRKEPKMTHAVNPNEPMEPSISTKRHGNITVGMKQLSNIILKGFLDESDPERPKDMNEGITAAQLAGAKSNGSRQHKKMEMAFKAQPFATGTSAGGAELIETDLSNELLMRFHMESALARVMLAQEVPMPSNPFKLPLRLARTKFRKKTENTEATGTDAGGTGEVVFDASNLIGIADWSYEIDADSVIASLPMFLNELSTAAADAFEGVLINGDDSGTHQDTDTEADSGAAERNFKGFRKLAIAGSQTRAVTSISAANMGLLKKDAKRFGHRASDCVFVISETKFQEVLELAEAKTVDVAGAAATFLSGQITRVWGVPVISSSQLREDMNATGVHDGVTETKTGVLFINFRNFFIGVRGGFLVETDVDKKAQQYSVIASFRRDMQPKEAVSATIPSVQYGYNTTV